MKKLLRNLTAIPLAATVIITSSCSAVTPVKQSSETLYVEKIENLSDDFIPLAMS